MEATPIGPSGARYAGDRGGVRGREGNTERLAGSPSEKVPCPTSLSWVHPGFVDGSVNAQTPVGTSRGHQRRPHLATTEDLLMAMDSW